MSVIDEADLPVTCLAPGRPLTARPAVKRRQPTSRVVLLVAAFGAFLAFLAGDPAGHG